MMIIIIIIIIIVVIIAIIIVKAITVDDTSQLKMLRIFGRIYGVKEKDLTNRLSGLNTEEINVKKQHQEWNKISKDELEFALNKSHN